MCVSARVRVYECVCEEAIGRERERETPYYVDSPQPTSEFNWLSNLRVNDTVTDERGTRPQFTLCFPPLITCAQLPRKRWRLGELQIQDTTPFTVGLHIQVQQEQINKFIFTIASLKISWFGLIYTKS